MTDSPPTLADQGNLVETLAKRVWTNRAFRDSARKAEIARLRTDLGLVGGANPHTRVLRKLVQSAGILSSSRVPKHRRAAYRIATNVHALVGEGDLSFAAAVRVVLSRLGNFPALATDAAVEGAQSRIPLRLLVDEIGSAEDRTVRVGQHEYVLTDFQHRLWRIFTRPRDAAIAAPTSAGKSFVLQHYLNSKYQDVGALSVVYLVPTRALISQVTSDLDAAVEDFVGHKPDVINVPPDVITPLRERVIYVLTPERLQLLLASHPEFHPGLVIVDEAHLIGDGARGILLQWVLDEVVSREPKPQLLFASPTISNLDVFGTLLGIRDIVETRSTEPTIAQNFIIARVTDTNAGEVELTTVGDGANSELPLGNVRLLKPLWSRFDKLVQIPAALGRGKLNIVYVNGAADAERIALRLAELHSNREPTSRQMELSQLARETVHSQYALATCLQRGIAFHYSNIPASLRTAVEHAFLEGDLDFMVCTSTLLQGVNTPAQNIFMFAPEKGSGRPIEPVDFWNLSGRAGRLRKEFQGNIFLIDYRSWRSRPLAGPKDVAVVPAIRAGISDTNELLRIISDAPEQRPRNRLDLESTFSKLLVDYQNGALNDAFARAGLAPDGRTARQLGEALSAAAEDVTLPSDIIKQSSNVSAHKQQKLYNELKERIRKNPKTAISRLSPRHPRDSNAYESYSSILSLCYRSIWERPEGSRLHRFHALIALWWMKGVPLPQIIQNQLDRQKDKERRRVIRDTLSLVEDHIRFRAVRVFTTYNALLALAYHNESIPGGLESIPSIPLFLELGASDRSMISFMELGLSRVAAMQLTQRAEDSNMDAAGAMSWLKSRVPEELGLSSTMAREVSRIRERRRGSSSL